MEETKKNQYDSAFQAGVLSGEIRKIGEHEFPFVMVPDECRVESLEKYLEKPLRKSSAPTFREPASFIEYFNKFKTPETILAYSQDTHEFRAIFDYHKSVTDRSWCECTVNLEIRRTKEWERWIRSNGNSFKQEEFAEFLEEMSVDIIKPASADVLEACLTLHAKKEGQYKSARRLDNGSFQFTYDETVSAQGQGSIEFPHSFVLGIKPFVGSDVKDVKVNLRYRINSGSLSFFYKLDRPDLVEDEAFEKFLDLIKEKTEAEPLNGSI